MPETLKGQAAAMALFDNLPKASDDELINVLPKMGAAVLAAQRQDVAIRTGDLWRGLSVQVLSGGHKIRVGIVGKADAASSKKSNLFYGRIVEFGRRGQVVNVQRRRRVGGRLRTTRGRKRAEDIVSTYTMKVPSAAPRPFVETPQAQAAALNAGNNLADFWVNVLNRAGAAGQ
jgi:hypothetical protein